ncbi:MAG: NAD(P)H-hydrate epimerase [Gemmatimonadales bacterium]|jgi:NAD(P)H-hydrate epimerase
MMQAVPTIADANTIPYVTAEQMRTVDRLMTEEYGVDLRQMMENAGRNLARLAKKRFCGGNPRDKSVAVLAGTGANGGGALACARWLHNWGAELHIFATADDEESIPATRQQLAVLRRMKIRVHQSKNLAYAKPCALVIDGVIGYNLKGAAPAGAACEMVRWANAQEAAVLALDLPSGLHPDSGAVSDPAVRATGTLTLGLPKTGLAAAEARPVVGELYLGDIGIPPALYGHPDVGIDVGPLFAQSEILRLG